MYLVSAIVRVIDLPCKITSCFFIYFIFSNYLLFFPFCSFTNYDSCTHIQVGTASIDLGGLLRQGRAYAELLLDVPVLRTAQQGSSTHMLQPQEAGNPAHAHTQRHAPPQAPPVAAANKPSAIGSMIVRLINIGREPRDTNVRWDW